MTAQRSQDSFHEHLDGRGSSFLETFDAVLVEAKVIRMTCNTSEWSVFQQALLLSCGRMASFFLLGAVVKIYRFVTHGQSITRALT